MTIIQPNRTCPLKNKSDVVTHVAAKYGIEKAQAQRDVDALMKGRQI